MSNPDNDANAVARLIAIGKSGEFASMSLIFSSVEQSRHPKLAPSHEGWLAVIESLGMNDLIALIKSLTIGERDFAGWRAGSVSPVKRLFIKLCSSDIQQAKIIADWIIEHSDNNYLHDAVRTELSKSEDPDGYAAEMWAHHISARKKQLKVEDAQKSNAAKRERNLFVAIQSGDEKGVAALIGRGAYNRELVIDGMTALQLAEAKGSTKIIEMLRAAGEDSN